MKAKAFELVRYDAEEGSVFDWKEPRYIEVTDEEGNVINKVREHLNVTTLFIGGNDNIANYVEVDAEGNITELKANVATESDYLAALAELGVE